MVSFRPGGVVENGRLIRRIGVAPAKPAEFAHSPLDRVPGSEGHHHPEAQLHCAMYSHEPRQEVLERALN
jgi:hypothetical protein